MRHSALANSYVRALGCPSVWRAAAAGGGGGGRMAPQRSQPGRHARCETEMFGPWTRYCKRRGKGGLKRRIMGRFFFAGCTRVGGRRDGRRRQAEDSRPQMGADCRAPLPSERAFAYKMKPEAMKRQGKCSALTSAQITQKSGRKTSR